MVRRIIAAVSGLISVRAPMTIAECLENLAKIVDHSKFYLAAEAIEN